MRMPKNVNCPNCGFCGNYGGVVVLFSSSHHNPELQRWLKREGTKRVGIKFHLCFKCNAIFYYNRNKRKWECYKGKVTVQSTLEEFQ